MSHVNASSEDPEVEVFDQHEDVNVFPTSILCSSQLYGDLLNSSVDSDIIIRPDPEKEEILVPFHDVCALQEQPDEPIKEDVVEKKHESLIDEWIPQLMTPEQTRNSLFQRSKSYAHHLMNNNIAEKNPAQDAGNSVIKEGKLEGKNLLLKDVCRIMERRQSSPFNIKVSVDPRPVLKNLRPKFNTLKIDLGNCKPLQELKSIGKDLSKKKAFEKAEREHIRKLERQRLILSLRTRAMSPANSIKSYSSTSTINSSTSSGYESLEELLDIDDIKLGIEESRNLQVPEVLKTKVIKNKDIWHREYIVQDILQIEEERSNPLFLVKWKGYNKPSDNTWEPYENINDCVALPRFLQYQCDQNRTVIYDILNEIMLEIEEQKFELSENLKKLTVIDDFNPMRYISDLLLLASFKMARSRNRVSTTKIRQRIKIALLQRPLYLRRRKQMLSILEWKESINVIETSANINVENNVDYDIPQFWSPENCQTSLNMSSASEALDESINGYFTYIKECLISPEIKVLPNTTMGCNCEDGCNIKSNCCSTFFQYPFAYNQKRKLRLGPGAPIYECNAYCKCGPDCNNRIVQNGRKNSLCIFKTSNNCGWGVKTEKPIFKGEYVCEYVGEVITSEEADRRGKVYDSQGRTYLFDLDYTEDGQAAYTVDAAHYGNVARFINHSCQPNLQVWPMWSNNLDPLLHRLAFFALEKIEAGQELSFNYIQNDIDYSDVSGSERKPCHCGAAKCKKWLFF